MKIEIPIYSTARYSCLRNLAISLIRYFSPESGFMLLSSQSWGELYYKYDADTDSFDFQTRSGNDFELLEKYYGIRSCQHTDMNSFWDDIVNSITEEIPLIYSIDSFYSPISPHYGICHSFHFDMISGYENGSVIINDAHSGISGYKIRFADLLPHVYGYWTLSYHGIPEPPCFRDLIADYMKALLKGAQNTFESVEALAEDLIRRPKVWEEIRNTEIFGTDRITAGISRIRAARRQYIEFLGAAQVEMKCLDDIIVQQHKALGLWDMITGILRKAVLCFAKSGILLRRASDKLSELAKFEKGLAAEILMRATGKSPRVIERIRERPTAKEYYTLQQQPLNLCARFNGKAFHHYKAEQIKARIFCDHHNDYFMYLDANSGFNDTQQLTVTGDNGLTYRLYAYQDNRNDHLICDEQYIAVQRDTYTEIAFLGCADGGAASDCIVFCYADGTEETAAFEFSDWACDDLLFGEKIFFRVSGRKNINGTVSPHLFNTVILSKTYSLKKQALLGFKLPFCPNMHIFAVTLIS